MFSDRTQAGKQLSKLLAEYKNNAIVLGIPRGGMVVAHEVANELNCPMSVLIVRKIGAPQNEELALGAVSIDEKPVWNENVLQITQPSEAYLKAKTQEKIAEVRERKERFGVKRLPSLKGKIVIVVDDGIATGASVFAALQWLKTQHPKKIILAVPCAPSDTAWRLRREVELVCLEESPYFGAVGQFYQDFREITDEKVKELLKTKVA